MRKGICLFGLLVCIAGSGMGEQKTDQIPVAPPSDIAGPIQFETRRSHKEYGHDCQLDKSPLAIAVGGQHPGVCVWFDLSYPEVISAPSEVAKTRINYAIRQWVLEESAGGAGERSDTIAKSQETLYQDFANLERQNRSAFSPDSLRGFWFQRKVKVVYQSANVLSLSRDQAGEAGGRENWRLDYANFRPSTGAPISLEDILKPGYEKSLNAYGEVRFRTLLHLAPSTSFEGTLFNFAPDGFYLNDNFAIGPKGLTFQYYVGEVGAIAAGGPAVFLPYSGLQRLIRPDANIP
jgi:hypothetical protein